LRGRYQTNCELKIKMKIATRLHSFLEIHKLLVFILVVFTVFSYCSCTQSSESQNQVDKQTKTDLIDGIDIRGNEDSLELGLGDSYDVTKDGVRLHMEYDQAANFFVGSVSNTTADTIENVRVRILLSNGTELGTSTPIILKAKMTRPLKLQAPVNIFEKWSAYVSVGNMENEHE